MAKLERSCLLLHRGDLVDARMRAAYDRLMRDVLGLDPPARAEGFGPWRPFAYFAPDGRCVANVDAAILPLVVDGETCGAGAIRSVAVDPDWRGRGLFRDLMTAALAWCEAGSTGPTLLFTEAPEIYCPFGFRQVPQHAFAGPAPAPTAVPPARQLDLDSPPDASLLREALGRRTPVSMCCTLLVDAALFAANVVKDKDVLLAYAAEIDACIAYETDADALTVVDIVAPQIPDLATVLGTLGVAPQSVKTLFPPDRIGWDGTPIREDTGLMLRGSMAVPMSRPFMFPPTAEF